MKDFYNILGVEPDASSDEIRKMYHKLSKKYHPDTNVDDPDLRQWSEARMKELNQAYDTLKDPLKRAQYDHRQGYRQPKPPPTAARPPTMTQLTESVVLRSAAMSAISFGLIGLLRGGLPFAISGAVMGAVLGAILGNIRISGLPPSVTQGIFLGMFLGAFLLKLSLAGLLIGGVVGGFVGWLLLNKR